MLEIVAGVLPTEKRRPFPGAWNYRRAWSQVLYSYDGAVFMHFRSSTLSSVIPTTTFTRNLNVFLSLQLLQL